MAVFNPIVITTAGISLLSQAMAGKGTLTFTSVATSTTVIPYNISNIQAMTALSGIMQTVVPVSAVLKTGNVQVSSIFSNSGVTNAYTANTIGLYAALGNGAQTLFAVAIATTPDNIPVQNDLSPSNFYYQFNIAISDTSQLTVTVPEDGSLPASVFNQMFPGITAPDQNNDGDALVYNASSGAWGYVNTETVFTTVSGSGEFVSLQKTLADDFKQIQLFGKSVQKPTTGAQLFDINTAKNYDEAEITDYSSGTMEIEQSNSAMLQSPKLKEWCPTMQAGQSYLLICETTSTKKYITIGSSQWDFGGIFIPAADDLEENVEWHCTTQRSTSDDIVYYRDTFAGIMIVEGSTEKPYEVYTGGEAATEPTPEFPLPITSAGNYDAEEEKYGVGIGVDGANLLDYESWKVEKISKGTGEYKDYGIVLTAAENDCYTNYDNYKIEVIPNTRYVLSWEIQGAIGLVYVFQKNCENTIIKFSSKSNSLGKFDFMTDKDTCYVTFRVGVDTAGNTATYKNIQLNVGDTPLEFRPFQGTQQKQLQIPNPLRGIPVNSGGNYTDSDGQQWICDYIDRERGKYVQCVQEIVFDGVSSGKKVTAADPAYYSNANYAYIETTGIKRYTAVISNKLKYLGSIENVDLECLFVTAVLSISLLNTRTGIVSTDSEQQRVDKINAVLKQWYDEGNPLVVYYQLANPIETDLTADQLAALNLSTYQGITNIGTDTMPQVGMAVESRGFNLAGDLAQNLIDLQSTVRSQGTAITQNETDIENINNVLNSPLVSYNGLLPVVNPSGIYTYKSVADIVYPIGSIYLSVNNINPGTIFGGTWVSWGSGRVPVGVNTSVSQFATVEQTGGEITHTLTTAEMPSHDHSISGGACTTGRGGSHNHTYGVTVHPAVGFTLGSNGYSTVTKDNQNTSSNGNHSHSVPDHAHDIGNTGGGQTHNNLQPYITCYMWKRTA